MLRNRVEHLDSRNLSSQYEKDIRSNITNNLSLPNRSLSLSRVRELWSLVERSLALSVSSQSVLLANGTGHFGWVAEFAAH